jgi:NACalpha-BTF3-like transcription factor
MRKKLFGLTIAAVLVAAGCTDAPTPIPVATPAGAPSRTVVIDSTRMRLVSTAQEQAEGIYRFRLLGAEQRITSGDVIVGVQGEGFLRRAAEVRRERGGVVLATAPASLADALGQNSFTFTIPIPPLGQASQPAEGASFSIEPAEVEYAAQGVRLGDVGVSLDHLVLAKGEGCVGLGPVQGCHEIEFGIESGLFRLGSSLEAGGDPSLWDGLKEAHVQFTAETRFDVDAYVSSAGNTRLSLDTTLLRTKPQHFFTLVAGFLPVEGTITTELVAELEVGAGGATQVNAGFTSSAAVTVGARWEAGKGFSKIWNPTAKWNTLPVRISSYPEVTAQFALKPVFKVRFYGGTATAGASVFPYLRFSQKSNLSTELTYSELRAGVDGEVTVDFSLFSHDLASFGFGVAGPSSVLWSRQGAIPRVPASAVVVSGDGQVARVGTQLAAPLVVRIVDAAGRPVPAAPVTFRVVQGSGTLSSASATTAADGQAQTRWTLGTQEGPQTVQANVVKTPALARFNAVATVAGSTAPAITSVSPNPVLPAQGEQTLTLSGSSFANGARLLFRVNGRTYEVKSPQVTVVSATQIRAQVTLGTTPAAWTVQVVNPNGLSSAQHAFRVGALAPSITGVSPDPAPATTGEQTLTITGAGFANGAKLLFRVNGSTYEVKSPKVTVVTATQIRAQVTLGTTGAAWTVQVANPDGQTSGQLGFRVAALAPSITGVSPDPAPATTGEQTLTVTGAGFASGAKLLFRVNGSTYEVKSPKVTVVTATQIRAQVTLGTTGAAWTVQVVNPDGQSSGQAGFRVAAPAPLLTGVSPNPAPGTTAEQTLTITGANFASGARLLFRVNGNTYEVRSPKVTVASASQIRAQVTLGTAGAVWTVQVVNPDGLASGQYAFTVVPPAPRISSVSPNPFPARSYEQTLSIVGSGFTPGDILLFRVNGNTYRVNSTALLGTSEIRARVNLGTTPATWTVEVVDAAGRGSGQYAFRVS